MCVWVPRACLFVAGIAMLALSPATTAQLTRSGVQGRAEESAPRYYALIIGIDKYEKWRNLETAANDARVLKAVLQEHYGFTEDRIKLLLDGEATGRRILAELDVMAQRLNATDYWLIYFAGHGDFEEFTGQGYWIPADADTDDKTTRLYHTRVTDYLKSDKLQARGVCLIADSCYAVTLMRGTPGGRGDVRSSRNPDPFGASRKLKSRLVITSGSKEPVPDGGRNNHSVFAYYFLEALRQNKEPEVDLERLLQTKVFDNVSRITRQRPQSSRLPTTMDEQGPFLLARGMPSPVAAALAPPEVKDIKVITGRVVVTTDKGGIQLGVDGQLVRDGEGVLSLREGLEYGLDLPIGERKFAALLNGEEVWQRAVRVKLEETSRVEINVREPVKKALPPAPAPTSESKVEIVARLGTIVISANRSGGTVYLDGEEVWRTDPAKQLRIRNQPAGFCTVVAKVGGQEVWKRRVEVREGEEIAVRVDLEEKKPEAAAPKVAAASPPAKLPEAPPGPAAPRAGGLEVKANRAGILIFLGSRQLGETRAGETVFNDILAGDHDVRATYNGKQIWRQMVSVEKGFHTIIRVDVPPEPKPEAAPPPAVAAPKPEPPAKAAPSGPSAGRVIWSGTLAKNARLIIEGNQPSSGAVVGALPGIPVRINAYPAIFVGRDLTIYSSDPRHARPNLAAGTQRNQFVFDAKRAAELATTETPTEANGWKRVGLQAKQKLSIIVIDWEAVPVPK